jgi:hypothetical protein
MQLNGIYSTEVFFIVLLALVRFAFWQGALEAAILLSVLF